MQWNIQMQTFISVSHYVRLKGMNCECVQRKKYYSIYLFMDCVMILEKFHETKWLFIAIALEHYIFARTVVECMRCFLFISKLLFVTTTKQHLHKSIWDYNCCNNITQLYKTCYNSSIGWLAALSATAAAVLPIKKYKISKTAFEHKTPKDTEKQHKKKIKPKPKKKLKKKNFF